MESLLKYKKTLARYMFTICVCLYEKMTKRCLNIIYLGSHFGKTVVNVYYACEINVTGNPTGLMTNEV